MTSSPATSKYPHDPRAAGTPFASDRIRGEVDLSWHGGEEGCELSRAVDAGNADETLHWGRNYLYTVDLPTAEGVREEVVVKQFRESRLSRYRLLGSKASKGYKSWLAAHRLLAAGVSTPRPVFWAEAQDGEPVSWFGCERLPESLEFRYYTRAMIAGREREDYPEIVPENLLSAIGELLARLHDGEVWHRDVSIGNLLIPHESIGEERPAVYLIDLNRCRLDVRMGSIRRTRDLCRLPILRPEYRDTFLRAYWGEDVSGFGLKKALFILLQRGFLLKNDSKALVRRPFRWLRSVLFARGTHAHIPPAPEDATIRDMAVWDHLSDQPHQHASRAERLRIRAADFGSHAEAIGAAVGSAPRIWRRYRRLQRMLPGRSTPWRGVGVAVRPYRQDEVGLLAAIEDLSVDHVLIRVHAWEEGLEAEERLARELSGRGVDVAFSVAQSCEVVRDLPRWRTAIEEVAERLTPYGRDIQIGQAINRSKWGVWNYREYFTLLREAESILRRDPKIRILGPGIIDFEAYATAAVLNMNSGGARLDGLASLLYVDRRGAPENTQLGFDTVDKALMLRAIAETARNSGAENWITEVNWPLREGPHSPAGRKVSVDEETQADYLVRYFLLTLCTGFVERVYWWQMIARGYGLIVLEADGSLRRRPAFRALATLIRSLEGATFIGRLATPAEEYVYRFRSDEGESLVVGWTVTDRSTIDLPGVVREVWNRDGERVSMSAGERVEIGTSPRYFRVE